MPPKSWPLYPVALTGKTHFILSTGYLLAGHPEHAKEYLAYCRQKGAFRKEKVTVPTRDRAIADFEQILKSKPWLDIRWTDSGPGWSYSLDKESTSKWIRKQAEDIR
jgi:hypothetical protein